MYFSTRVKVTGKIRSKSNGPSMRYFRSKGQASWGIAWYINDLLIPEIYVERGQTYTFIVQGGAPSTLYRVVFSFTEFFFDLLDAQATTRRTRRATTRCTSRTVPRAASARRPKTSSASRTSTPESPTTRNSSPIPPAVSPPHPLEPSQSPIRPLSLPKFRIGKWDCVHH